MVLEKRFLKKMIQIASGKIPADTVIKNCKVLDVFSGRFVEGDIAFCEDRIAGIGTYSGKEETDAQGRYAVPGLIDGHIHIESSYLCPEELGRMLIPRGTTTIIADPHEIVNVCGIKGLDYMIEASKNTKLDIRFMLPSCVPATPFENAGAVIGAEEMGEPVKREEILGLGEFMNFPGVLDTDDAVLEKLLLAKKEGKLIDGHAPGLTGLELNAYAAAGIRNDHELTDAEAVQDRISRGMYALLREGSACHDLRTLLKGVTSQNSHRCMLCTDDCQPKTILQEGHLDKHLRICVEEGLDAVTALRMATINAAQAFRLEDRGAIAPGYRADIVLFDDLKTFKANRVWAGGELVAQQGAYLPAVECCDISEVMQSVFLRDFSKEKLKMHLKSDIVHAIEIQPGGVVTKKVKAKIDLDADGEFVWSKDSDITKVAVVERHQGTGNVACGFLKGYGIQSGAIAVSIAHDSHNIIVVGVTDDEMEYAVKCLEEQKGGIVLVKEGRIIESMPMPIAGLMSDRTGEWVAEKVEQIHETAYLELGISREVEPVMTLCFMSLAVIPEIKLTDMGLFDVQAFSFIPVEAE